MKILFFRIITVFVCLLCSALSIPSKLVYAEDGPPFYVHLPQIHNNFEKEWNFQPPIRLQLQPAPFSKPYLIIDSKGIPHILWDTWSAEKTFIYHSYLSEGGWSPPNPIANTLGRSKLLNPPVAGKNGDLHLVWHNELTTSGPFRLMYASWDGTKWKSELPIYDQAKWASINGLIRLDQNGIPHVAMLENEMFTTKIYYWKWLGSGFSNIVQISRPLYSSVVWLDTRGGVHFFGDNSMNNSIHYSIWRNGSFEFEGKAIPGKIGLRPTFLDGLNNVHFIRAASAPIPGGSVQGVYHQCLRKDFTWSQEKVLSNFDAVKQHTVVYDENINPIIAWELRDSRSFQVTIWDGCNLINQRQIFLPDISDEIGAGEFITVSRNTTAQRMCHLQRQLYSSTDYWLSCTD